MSLIITSRPDKTVGSFTSVWNAVGGSLPVKYTFSSSAFPVNNAETANVINSVSDNKGFAEINQDFSSGAISLVAGSFVSIDGGVYSGVYRVKRITGTYSFIINAPFVSTDTGTFVTYYSTYKANIQVYLDGSLAGTKQITPQTNSFTVDIKDLLKEGLVDGVKSFYIDFYETYLVGGTQVTGSTTSDSANTFKAVYSTLQFQNAYGGNLFEYVVGNGTEAKWLTEFVEPVYFTTNTEWSVSLLSDDGSFSLTFTQLDINGTTIAEDVVAYSTSAGIVEVDFSNITLDSGTRKVQISGSEVETINVNIDGTTCN